jgi:hypothetical protein
MITKPDGPATYEWAMTQAEELASTLQAVLKDPEGWVAGGLASTRFYDPATVPPPSTLDYAMRAIHSDLDDLFLLAIESGEFSPGERTGFVRYLLRFWTRDDLESAIMRQRMRQAFDPEGTPAWEPAWWPDWEAAGPQSRHGKQSSHGGAGLRQVWPWQGVVRRGGARQPKLGRRRTGLARHSQKPAAWPAGEGPASGPGLAEDYVAGGRLAGPHS